MKNCDDGCPRGCPHDANDPRYAQKLATEANRRPEMYFHAHDPEGDSGVMCWLFPRGMKDKDIRAEVARQGYDENKPCRCSDGDCCGATFTRRLVIEQGRHKKRAEMFAGRCL